MIKTWQNTQYKHHNKTLTVIIENKICTVPSLIKAQLMKLNESF